MEWTQPDGGKKITWRHLKVGDLMDLDAAYNRPEVAHLRQAASLAMRIVSFDGSASKFSVTDFRDWETDDYEAFKDEVEYQEASRAHALAAKRAGGSAVAALERSVEAANLAALQFGQAIQAVMVATKAAEGSLIPLKQAESSRA